MKRKFDLENKEWTVLVDELMSARPRLKVIQERMVAVGLKPGADLLGCMETVLNCLEPGRSPSRKPVTDEVLP